MSNYHEPAEELSQQARNFSRALQSLKEEVEAIDWYHQRMETTDDQDLADLLAHNRDEEIEHACMTLEWLRRNMPGWDGELKKYLFKEGSITGHEKSHTHVEDQETSPNFGADSLGLGKIKNDRR
jgi:uncharacterized protein